MKRVTTPRTVGVTTTPKGKLKQKDKIPEPRREGSKSPARATRTQRRHLKRWKTTAPWYRLKAEELKKKNKQLISPMLNALE